MISGERADPRPDALPPSNVDAEQSVLGAILLESGVINRVAGVVAPDDFYDEKHAEIYAAMLRLHARSVALDYITLLDELERTGKLETVGGFMAITGLIANVATTMHAEHHAQIVADAAYMRRLISAGGKIATIGFQNRMPPETASERSDAILRSVARNRTSGTMTRLSDVLAAYMDVLSQAATTPTAGVGCPTGFGDLDAMLGGGLQRSDLIIVAARPSMGKTAQCLAIAANAAIRYGASVAMFSLEMSAAQIAARLMAIESGLPGEELRSGVVSDARRLGSAIGILAEANFWLDDRPSLSVGKIRDTAIRLHEQHPLDLIIVDHMQLVTLDGRHGNRTNEMTEISRQLKALARDLAVPVLALSQLSRATEQRSSRVPILSDLRESGAIEQDADVVWFIHREQYYNAESERRGLADIYIAKQRNGRTGKLTMLFDARTTRFYDLALEGRH